MQWVPSGKEKGKVDTFSPFHSPLPCCFWSFQDWNGERGSEAGWRERGGGRSLHDCTVIRCFQALWTSRRYSKPTCLTRVFMAFPNSHWEHSILLFGCHQFSFFQLWLILPLSFSKPLPVALGWSSWEAFAPCQLTSSGPSKYLYILCLNKRAPNAINSSLFCW